MSLAAERQAQDPTQAWGKQGLRCRVWGCRAIPMVTLNKAPVGSTIPAPSSAATTTWYIPLGKGGRATLALVAVPAVDTFRGVPGTGGATATWNPGTMPGILFVALTAKDTLVVFNSSGTAGGSTTVRGALLSTTTTTAARLDRSTLPGGGAHTKGDTGRVK